MNKSFFLKRSFEIKLRECKQFVEVSVGVSGEIDPENGMIINLSIVDQWFKKFKTDIEDKNFSDLLDFLNIAEIFFKKQHSDIFSIQLDCQQATALPFSLRWQYEEIHLALRASLTTAENFQISFLIKNPEELEKILSRYLKNQTSFSKTEEAVLVFRAEDPTQISGIKIENPSLRRAFVKSLD